jgi:hypothetical protein
MASILKVDTLTGVTTAGSISVTGEGGSTTTNLQQGLAKAWVDIPSGQASINDSLNVSSLDDDGTGDGGINLSSSFGGVNYSIAMGAEDGGNSSLILAHDLTSTTKVAGGYDFETFYVNASFNRTNADIQSFSTMFGDLA